MSDVKIKVWSRKGLKRRVMMLNISVGEYYTNLNDVRVDKKRNAEIIDIVKEYDGDDKTKCFMVSEMIELDVQSWGRIINSVATGECKMTNPYQKIKRIGE